jgi:catechol 2,3-dioxygenase-like lactoylglutathione lyase family enzyme
MILFWVFLWGRERAIFKKSQWNICAIIIVNQTEMRKTMITRLSHTGLMVRDQAQAYDVYVNKLGFKVHTDVTMDNGFRWLTVSPPTQPDLEVVLSEPVEPMFAADLIPHVRALLDKDAMSGGVWESDNCQKTYEDLKAKGIEFIKPPTKEFYGIEALFKDGCGNWFSLTEHPKE